MVCTASVTTQVKGGYLWVRDACGIMDIVAQSINGCGKARYDVFQVAEWKALFVHYCAISELRCPGTLITGHRFH